MQLILRAAPVALVLLALPAHSQSNRDDLTPLGLHYTLTVDEDLEQVHVELQLQDVVRPVLHLEMPDWAPGSYRLRRFGERLQELRAVTAEGTELELLQVGRGRWSLATQGAHELVVSYTLPPDRRPRFGRRIDEDQPPTGMHLEGPATFPYIDGALGQPVTIDYVVPDGWGVANGLQQLGDPLTRRARDYDTFVDAPTILGRFEQRSFEVEGTPFHCVFFEHAQEYDFDIDAFVSLVERIVRHQGELFGSYPFPDYWFLFTLPGGGGLEHLNSTSVGLSPRNQRRDPASGASVTSHEFFHAWNVKRIRPETLGPFDYQRENYTGNLWVAEGWTSYFGDLTLARTEIWDRDRYLSHLRSIIRSELNKSRREEHSVTWASRNVWHRYQDEEGSRVDYYSKGELLALVIDLEIRHQSDGRLSLNDVMRFLNRWFPERGVGYAEGDIERACTAVSNYDFAEFFARHVDGRLDPPFARVFDYVGIEYSENTIPATFPFRLRRGTIRRALGRADDEVEEGEPRPGEILTHVDGEPFEDADSVLSEHAPGDVVRLTLEDDDTGEARELEVTLGGPGRMTPSLAFVEEPTERQLRLREAWLTSAR